MPDEPGAEPSPPSPVRDMRDSFGDPKPPDISRKITACVACRKQKIKCHMLGSQPPCTRCRKRGLSCTVNRSLQMLLESDTAWKYSMEKKMQMMQSTIDKLANHASMGETASESSHGVGHQSTQGTAATPSQSSNRLTGLNAQDHSHWDLVLDPDSSPGAAPGSYIARTATAPTPSDAVQGQDLVSKEVISREHAELYFNKYQQRLDHFVYRILGDHSTVTFERVRDASPLLMAAICTVGALHFAEREQDFAACRNEFMCLWQKQSLSQASNIADIRALCIGAFWLADLSWPLACAAVRRATDLQLHKSFFKAATGDKQHYLHARLYYHVYTCDHHASIAFGKPPMTRECEAIREARTFLTFGHATEDDARLVSQVCRWSLLSGIYDTFGVDVDRPISDREVPQLRKFGIALDSLWAEWADRFIANAHVGNYPRKGVNLQYYFAKLYLYSHAFRGSRSGNTQSRSHDMTMELDEIANVAVLSALAILRSLTSDPEIQSFLSGLPIYFDVMITFAVVLLLKVSTRPSAYIRLDIPEVRRLVGEAVTTLKCVTSTMHPSHMLVSISNGIEGLLQRFDLTEHQVTANVQDTGSQLPETEAWNKDFTFDPYFWGTHDFQFTPDMDLGLDFSLFGNSANNS